VTAAETFGGGGAYRPVHLRWGEKRGTNTLTDKGKGDTFKSANVEITHSLCLEAAG